MTLGTMLDNMKKLDMLESELKRVEQSIKSYEAQRQAPDPQHLTQQVELAKVIKELRDQAI